MREGGPEDRLRPSDAATRRLRMGLESGIAAFTEEIDADLLDIERAVAVGREDLAVEVLEEHLARLERFSEQLKLAVAGAAVEREAEDVLSRAARDLPAQAAPRPPGRGALSRGALVVACVAIVAVLAVGVRPPAGDPLLAAVTASEQALDAARDAATGSVEGLSDLAARSADLRTAISRLDVALLDDPLVRQRLQMMLVDQQRVLSGLSPRLPAVAGMLAELEALARSLGLPLPELVPDVIDVDDLPLVLEEPSRQTTAGDGPSSTRTGPADVPATGPLGLPGPQPDATPVVGDTGADGADTGEPGAEDEVDEAPAPDGTAPDGAAIDDDDDDDGGGTGDAPPPSEDEGLEDLLDPPPPGAEPERVESAPDALGLS